MLLGPLVTINFINALYIVLRPVFFKFKGKIIRFLKKKQICCYTGFKKDKESQCALGNQTVEVLTLDDWANKMRSNANVGLGNALRGTDSKGKFTYGPRAAQVIDKPLTENQIRVLEFNNRPQKFEMNPRKITTTMDALNYAKVTR
jgi:hypothetical protein